MWLLWMVAGLPAAADTLEVCETCAYVDLDSAIAAAVDGDSIALDAGTWEVEAEVDIRLHIVGVSEAATTLVPASDSAGPLLHVGSSGHLTVEAVTLDGEGAVQGIVATGGELTVWETTVTRGYLWSGRGGGAGIAALDGAALTIQDSTFTDNLSLLGGGAIYAEPGPSDLSIESSHFEANETNSEGAGVLVDVAAGLADDETAGSVTLHDLSFVDEAACTGGGAVTVLADGGPVVIEGVTAWDTDVSGCHSGGASADTAALFVSGATGTPDVSVVDTVVDNLVGWGAPAGVRLHDVADVTLANLVLHGPFSGLDSGDGVHVEAAEGVALTWALVTYVEGMGAALYDVSGALEVTHTAVVAGDAGVGAFDWGDEALLRNNAVWDCSTGVYLWGTGSVVVSNTLLADLSTAISGSAGIDSAGIRYNAFHEIGSDRFLVIGGSSTAVDATNLEVSAPGLWRAPDALSEWSDFQLRAGSPLVDAGDPDVTDWLDGSRSDIGVFGGSGAPEAGVWDTGEPPDSGGVDTGEGDTGRDDTGGEADSGGAGDTGGDGDSGASEDSGSSADSGTSTDSGSSSDSGSSADSGTSTDSGSSSDSGSTADSGTSTDTGGSSPTDSGDEALSPKPSAGCRDGGAASAFALWLLLPLTAGRAFPRLRS
ncbi:MAG: right-handed parallel beta-helix repeat-containing protein [Alphaproteobacteria bacterium]|nr:right-handed parallel beta-helix repeat-containing protein [Alphaproteobacteria bacterium]